MTLRLNLITKRLLKHDCHMAAAAPPSSGHRIQLAALWGGDVALTCNFCSLMQLLRQARLSKRGVHGVSSR